VHVLVFYRLYYTSGFASGPSSYETHDLDLDIVRSSWQWVYW